jgi:hypothetical protein
MGRKVPILVDLVPVRNRSENKWEIGNLWVTDLQENSEFKIDDNISWFMYPCDTDEMKKICLGRTDEGCQVGKHERGY